MALSYDPTHSSYKYDICKVKNCSNNTEHTTLGHKCGICGTLGHGMYECFTAKAKINLMLYFDDTLQEFKQCTVADCKSACYHTTHTHPYNNYDNYNIVEIKKIMREKCVIRTKDYVIRMVKGELECMNDMNNSDFIQDFTEIEVDTVDTYGWHPWTCK